MAKKSFRFPILAKVIFLTGVLTALVSGSALVTASILSYSRTRDNYIQNTVHAGETLDSYISLSFNVEITSSGKQTTPMALFADVIIPRYESYIENPEKDNPDVYATYIDDLNTALFGAGQGMIGYSEDMGRRNHVYVPFITYMQNICLDYDIRDVYVDIYDKERNNLIVFANNQSVISGDPCGEIKAMDMSQELFDFYQGSAKKYRSDTTDLVDTYLKATLPFAEGNQNFYLMLHTKKSLTEFNEESLRNITTQILISLGAAIVLMAVYAVLAKFFIINNITKAKSSAIEFTESMSNKNNLAVAYRDVNSRDEVGDVYRCIIAMEEAIVSYVDTLAEAKNAEAKMNAELQVASKIQLESLPNPTFFYKNSELRAYIKPAKEVGGDFYDYFLIDDDHLVLVIADVSGKGVPASLFMMKAKENIRSIVSHSNSLGDAFYEINNILSFNNKENYFVTAFLAIYEYSSHKFRFINAGHERPYIIKKDGSVAHLEIKPNFVLGLYEDFKYEEESITLEEGDKIFLHTDGLNEAINNKQEEFGYLRIKEALTKGEEDDTKLKIIEEELAKFSEGLEPFDDTTMLLFDLKVDYQEFNYKNPGYDVIEDATNKINKYLEKNKIDKDKISKVDIILDEVLNNIISYSRTKEAIKEISVGVEIKCDEAKLYFLDNGHKFDPLATTIRTAEENIENGIIGGLGISIVRQISKEVKYIYNDKKNVLIVRV